MTARYAELEALAREASERITRQDLARAEANARTTTGTLPVGRITLVATLASPLVWAGATLAGLVTGI